jgi:hypothetical protein
MVAFGAQDSRKQRRYSMPLVIMRLPGGDARCQRQNRFGPIQRLDLTLFIYTQHDGAVRRVHGDRGKGWQRQRGERIERNFAHQFDTGGLDRLYVRGKENVHQKFLMQAAACNLALLMRSAYGSGKPRAAHDAVIGAILTIVAVMRAGEDHFPTWSVDSDEEVRVLRRSEGCSQLFCRPKKSPV